MTREPPAERGCAAAGGAELVELSERFYGGLFVGGLAFVGLASVAALAILPLRRLAHGPPVTFLITAGLALAAPFAVWRAGAVYRALRRDPRLELVLVVLSAALVAYPLRSELWWPACALITVIGILAPLRRTLACCLVVLLTNLAAHAIAGDLSRTPAVAVIGLWIGFPFWSATFSVFSDRFAAHVLRLQTSRPGELEARVRVDAWVDGEPSEPVDPETPPEDRPAPAEEPRARAAGGETTMSRLTARQLQVTALLVDGLRYREVAACLSLSERQVQRHVANAIARAGVRTANELAAVAVAEGLAVPGPGAAVGAEG